MTLPITAKNKHKNQRIASDSTPKAQSNAVKSQPSTNQVCFTVVKPEQPPTDMINASLKVEPAKAQQVAS